MSKWGRINLPDHQAALDDLDRLKQVLDLQQGNLGIDLNHDVADAILACMAAESDTDGQPWPPLGHTYEEWKAIVAPGQPIGVLFGTMRQVDQLRGETHIAPDSLTMTYGTDAVARLHALRFQEGQAVTGWPNHQPRPFYYLGTAAVAAADRHIDAHFNRFTI